jgi:hypothetical protein
VATAKTPANTKSVATKNGEKIIVFIINRWFSEIT